MTGVSFVIPNEPLSVTPGFMLTHKQVGPLDSLRMGPVTGKTGDQRAGTFSPTHQPPS